jgi:predicted permease
MHAQILEAVKAAPGVSTAALAKTIPVHRGGMRISFEVPGRKPASSDEILRANFNPVSPGYFAAMGVPIVAGRDFDASDNFDATIAVVIVDEAFVRAYLPGKDPVGAFLEGGAFVTAENEPVRIVGVARSIRYRTLREDPEPTIYVPLAQTTISSFSILARGPGDPSALAPALTAAVQSVEPTLPLYRVRALEEHVALASAQGRVLAGLVAAFALAALALAVAGTFGVVAYRTQGRLREFGIRMALGALPRQVVRLVLSKGFAAAGTGLSLGLLLAWAAAPQAAAFLFGVSPRDPLVFVAVAAILLAAYLVASALPARRAARTDPAAVLRSE